MRLVMNFLEEVILWNDYSTTDIFLAVRDMTEGDALVKPPTKLVNAWMAGVPALLGPEPSFLRLKRCDLDFIEVRTPTEAFAAIRRLKDNPELYRQMVVNGRVRARDFTVDQIARRWVEIPWADPSRNTTTAVMEEVAGGASTPEGGRAVPHVQAGQGAICS